MITEEKVINWIKAKETLNAAKAVELDARKEICEHILAGKIKGTKKATIGAFVLTATAKLNNKIDADLLNSLWEALTPEEKASVKFTPTIIAAEYKKLAENCTLNRTIDSKPGTPSLTLKEIKNK